MLTYYVDNSKCQMVLCASRAMGRRQAIGMVTNMMDREIPICNECYTEASKVKNWVKTVEWWTL